VSAAQNPGCVRDSVEYGVGRQTASGYGLPENSEQRRILRGLRRICPRGGYRHWDGVTAEYTEGWLGKRRITHDTSLNLIRLARDEGASNQLTDARMLVSLSQNYNAVNVKSPAKCCSRRPFQE